jgi:predicted CoA-substrate-specific enzyme activase
MEKTLKYYAGIDVGSLATKVVLLDNDGKIVSYAIINSRSDPQKAAYCALNEVLSKANIKRDQVGYIVATGYGRIALDFVNRTITELTCHARGVHYLCPTARTVIDIGGQDSKVLKINERGDLIDFTTNDKCAAGTGRFLEVMASILEIGLDQIGEFSLRSNNPLRLSSTCTVFAESEVISLLASKQRKEDIAAGIHHAIAVRVGNMAKSLGIQKEVVFVGGVAKNIGVKKALEQFLKVEFVPLQVDPQITGALGAALLARDSQ